LTTYLIRIYWGADVGTFFDNGGGHHNRWGCWRGRRKSKYYKTNPNLSKPAWKSVNRKAKNEPKLRLQASGEDDWADGVTEWWRIGGMEEWSEEAYFVEHGV
jgi:hypothetical protein